MSHDIDMSNGRANMFSGSNITPWHKLGRVVEGRLTAAEAIVEAGLDWTVDLAPVTARVYNENGFHDVELEDLYAPFRTDTGATFNKVVGGKYTIFQNVEGFDLLDEIVADSGSHFETAGSLSGGAQVWMMLVPDESEITLNGEPMKKYLLCTTSHDGTSSLRVKPVVERVVCANTLSFALGESGREFRARHTASITGKAQSARAALGLSFAYFDEFETIARRLADVDMGLTGFRDLVDTLVPMVEDGKQVEGRARTIRQNKRNGMRNAWRSDVSGVVENGWKGVQAINTWELWGSEDRANAEKQARRVVAGADAPLTQRAVNLLLTH